MRLRDQISELLERQPFGSFRIRSTAGDSYDIMHQTEMAILRRSVFITFAKGDRFVFLPYGQIAAIESLDPV